jgi:hypothetical protein
LCAAPNLWLSITLIQNASHDCVNCKLWLRQPIYLFLSNRQSNWDRALHKSASAIAAAIPINVVLTCHQQIWPSDWPRLSMIKDRLLQAEKNPPDPFASRTHVWPKSIQLSGVLARNRREKLMHAVCLADFAIFKFRQTTLAILLRSFCFFIVVVSSLAYFLFSNLNELFAYVVGLFIAFFSLFLLSFVKIFEAPRILVDRQKWRDWYSPDRPN